MKNLRTLVFVLLVAAVSIPAAAQRGSANFTRYVALGDSLTAGYSSSSLVLTRQDWSYPSIIAEQAGVVSFQQPLISQPGIPAELALQSLSPLVLGPKAQGNGHPINLQLPRPYDNLGIPGARVGDLLTRTGATPDANPFYQIILRGLGPAAAQAAFLQPTFISVWIGNNDVLGAVTSGIASDATLTPIGTFTTQYETLLDTLIAAAPSAGMVTAKVPPVTRIPFATVLPPVLIDPRTRQPVPGPDGNPILLIAEQGDGSIAQLTPGSRVLLTAQPFLASGYGIPAALGPVIPLPNVGKPLPNAVVLDGSELAAIEAHRNAINAVITSAARIRDVPVIDFDPIFAEFAEGVHIGGVELSLDFLTGGVMSYDGVHPTDIGYLLIANAFIERINEAWDGAIPYASLLQLFADNAPEDASLIMLPPWMQLNLLEAPWTEFRAPFAAPPVERATDEEPEPEPSRRRTTRSRG